MRACASTARVYNGNLPPPVGHLSAVARISFRFCFVHRAGRRNGTTKRARLYMCTMSVAAPRNVSQDQPLRPPLRGGGFFSLYVIKTRAATQMHSTRAKRCSANVRQSTSVPFDVFFPFPNDRRRRERVLNNKYNEYVVVIVDGTKQFFFHEIFSGVYANVSETPNGERNFFGSFRVRSRKRIGKIKPSNKVRLDVKWTEFNRRGRRVRKLNLHERLLNATFKIRNHEKRTFPSVGCPLEHSVYAYIGA